ncbi:MAG: hypothetical protein KDC85_18580 [Saprospiraceae bacterium]|nr:hypothetical protein [Saprospiraceae bacterium]MCB9323368.1 hypothetical protein [Lewinellaceae bacterium]
MKNLSYVLAFVFSVALMQSCQKEPLIDTGAPELPSKESFIMPFTGFEDTDTTKSFSNWFYAASNVVVWNAVLTVNLAVPVASFYESFNHDAQFQGNSTWMWSYSFNAQGSQYTAKLYGQILNDNEVGWEMYISRTGAFTDVQWYNGVTAIDRSYATWTLRQNGFNPTDFIGIEYHADNGNGARSIRYTNIIPNNQGNGGYIEYQETLDNTATFNRSYDVFKIELNNLLEIDWNNINNEGRVKDPQKYNDEDWHCWDSGLQDTQC